MSDLEKKASPEVGDSRSRSPDRGVVYETHDHGAESELHRNLSTRHITMIALGERYECRLVVTL